MRQALALDYLINLNIDSFSSFNNTNLLPSMLADCCMLPRREWGLMAAIEQRQLP